MLSKETTWKEKKVGTIMKVQDRPIDRCYECGTWKPHSSNCMSYLCGKCYLKNKHKMRLKKGLKWLLDGLRNGCMVYQNNPILI